MHHSRSDSYDKFIHRTREIWFCRAAQEMEAHMLVPVKGGFYEFHGGGRVSTWCGTTYRTDIEIGPEISEKEAVRQVGLGVDVYPPGRFDAYKSRRRYRCGHNLRTLW